MIKLFVSDMDGTLLHQDGNPHAGISEANIQAVRELHDLGIEFMMATGREHHYRHILKDILGFEIDAIGMNGANVVIDGELISNHALSYQDTEDVLKAVDATDIEVNFLGINVDGDYVFQHINQEPFNNFFKMYQEGSLKHVSSIDIYTWIQDSSKPPFNKLVGLVKDETVRDRLMQYISTAMPGRFDVIFSGRNNVELMPIGISKGMALKEVMKRKGLKPEDVAVIGDSMNDVSMLKVSPHSFIMSHAEADIKPYARYEVESVDEAIRLVLNKKI